MKTANVHGRREDGDGLLFIGIRLQAEILKNAQDILQDIISCRMVGPVAKGVFLDM